MLVQDQFRTVDQQYQDTYGGVSDTAKSKSNGFTSKAKEQQHQQRGRKLTSAQSQKVFKPVTYVEKMQSKLTVLKKKMEIDEGQHKYGPSNKVNLPGDHHYSQLYFNTNPDSLQLKQNDNKSNNNNNNMML